MKTTHQTEHTPGPWSFSGQAGDGWIMAHNGFKRIRVARVFEANPAMGFADSPDSDVAAANLRLIAAAPELLAALEEITLAYINARVRLNELEGAADNTPLTEKARAAIAKATGK